MTPDEIITKHHKEIGSKGGKKIFDQIGVEGMKKLSSQATRARRMKMLIPDFEDPSKNCKVCGASHEFITDKNRQTYREAHLAFIKK